VKTVYICGPMRGRPDLGRGAFRQAEARLRELGYHVINPAVLPIDLPWRVYMPICLAMCREADMIAPLPGWTRSSGARLEMDYARQTGKHVFWFAETEEDT